MITPSHYDPIRRCNDFEKCILVSWPNRVRRLAQFLGMPRSQGEKIADQQSSIVPILGKLDAAPDCSIVSRLIGPGRVETNYCNHGFSRSPATFQAIAIAAAPGNIC